MRWWLGRQVPAFGASSPARQEELLDRARHEAFRSRPDHGAGILVAALAVGAVSVALFAALAWFGAASVSVLTICAAAVSPFTSGAAYGYLHARALVGPLREIAGG
ncbi:MAG: hypothetical protein HC809_10865 [Gammaproteobacteria bacterium]|nr:hypothetical protein [Gammaproteobacteria bacterium]